jgi:hypothetical protein
MIYLQLGHGFQCAKQDLQSVWFFEFGLAVAKETRAFFGPFERKMACEAQETANVLNIFWNHESLHPG